MTARRPISLERATEVARPGQVVCLLRGVYNTNGTVGIDRSGAPGRRIVYRGGVNGRAIVRWRGGDNDLLQITQGTHHITVKRLTVVGGTAGIKIHHGAHHVRVIANRVQNNGACGVLAKNADHVRIVRNRIFNVGYGKGWCSGISLNTQVWIGRQPGFHSIVARNVISGSSDESGNDSEGNGIIIDLGGNAPPVLVANNVIYQNGGRCIHPNEVNNVWVVNNTCYKNTLDDRLGSPGELAVSENTSNIHLINNLVHTDSDGYAVKVEGGGTLLRRNIVFGGREIDVDGNVSKLEVRRMFPGFRNPPRVFGIEFPQRRALPPWRIGKRLALRAGAGPIGNGIDPRKTRGVTPAIRRALTRYAVPAMAGVRRPQGARFDVGAYER